MGRVGIMQGRLIPDENNRIQSFPRTNWRKEFPIMETIGLSLLEWTFDYENLWENPILTSNGFLEVKELSEQHKVQVLSATADNLMQAPIHKLNNNLSTSVEDCINFLGLLASTDIQIVVWPLVDGGNLNSKKEFDTFVEKFEPVARSIENMKIKVIFETDLPPEYNLRLIYGISSKSVGINLDIGNTASYGYKTSREFEVLGDWIQHVHIKDRTFRGGTVPLGSGDVDWIDTVQAIQSSYSGNLILQTARKPDHVHAIREYLDFCEKVGLWL